MESSPFDFVEESPVAGEGETTVPAGEHDTMDQMDPFADVDGGASDFKMPLPAVGSSGASPLEEWEANRAKELAARHQKLRDAKQKAAAEAAEDMQRFLKEREQKLEKTKAANRSEEKQWRADTTALMERGGTWEKVAKMSNLQARAASVKEPRNERMRKLLVSLKNDKNAPSADAASPLL